MDSESVMGLRDKWLISPSVLFDCWNYRVVADDPVLMEWVFRQKAMIGGNCERILAQGWLHSRSEEENDLIMVTPFRGNKINRGAFRAALKRYLKLAKKYRQITIVDLFCHPYQGFGKYMPFPDLYSDLPSNRNRRKRWIKFLLKICRGYNVILSIGNELIYPNGVKIYDEKTLKQIRDANVRDEHITGNLLLHVHTINQLLSEGIKFDAIMCGFNFSFGPHSKTDEGAWLKANLDRIYGQKLGIDLGATMRRTAHGFGLVDDNLETFVDWFGGSAVKWFLSDDGQCGGSSLVDWTIDPITGQRDAKPSREEKRAMMKILIDRKTNPATGIWGIESINEGIWENVIPVKEKLETLYESGMLGGTQGAVDVYIERFGKPANMRRFAEKESA